jgi:hypothetical protein
VGGGHGRCVGGIASATRACCVAHSLGHMVQVNYGTKVLECVFKLHDGPIHSVAINEGFCVTASADRFLRVWPLDFSDFFLEAHVCAAQRVWLVACPTSCRPLSLPGKTAQCHCGAYSEVVNKRQPAHGVHRRSAFICTFSHVCSLFHIPCVLLSFAA